jgi:hypothetical protein
MINVKVCDMLGAPIMARLFLFKFKRLSRKNALLAFMAIMARK